MIGWLTPRAWRPLAMLTAAASFVAFSAVARAEAPSTYDVVPRELPQTFAAEGVVEAVRQATIAGESAGRIVELRVTAGDRVRAGEVLARIDARDAEHAVAASDSNVAEAEANLANAKRSYERQRELAAQRFVSAAAVDQAEAAYKAAHAQVASLKSAAGQARTQRSLATIVAPFAGVIGATHAELGDLALPGRPIVTVFEPGELRVTATLPQSALGSWRRELPVRIELPALSRSLVATRSTLVPLADARTHTVKVRLTLPAVEGLLPGQFARAQFPTGTVRALAVPASALLRRGEVTAVYVIDRAGAARLRHVRTGETLVDAASGPYVEILAGLSPGERIAVDPLAAGLSVAASR